MAYLRPLAVIAAFTTARGERRFDSIAPGGVAVAAAEHQRTPGLRAFREAGDG